MSKPFGLVLTGKLVGEEIKETKTKAGTLFRTRTIAIQTNKLQNILVDVPLEFKIIKDKNDVVVLPVETTAKHWSNETKRFEYVQVKFYVQKDEVMPAVDESPTL